jgi:3-carboxy-cis,cis-muconate cycloisomerase
MAATVAAARDPELAGGLADALTPSLGRGAAHDAAADAVRESAASGRPLREVLADRTDVDVPALLRAGPDTGETGAQVDAVLAEHARLTEGTP